jgi:hypothetical protein
LNQITPVFKRLTMYRYATIITDADGQEIVSAIGEFEGTAP